MRRLPLLKVGTILALSLSVACATARPPAGGEFAAATSDLDLRAVLLLQVDRQIYEPVTVRRALSGNAAMRETLADALGRIPAKRGRGVLEGLLLDEAASVRRAAAFALGELEDPEAVGALLNAATDADRETGMLAVEALGKLKVPVVDVAQVLLSLPEDERWARLLPPLFRFHEDNAVALAERGLQRPEPELHAWAAYALARDPLPAGLAPLRRLLADPDPQVRAWAARGLGIVGEAEDIPPLTRLFGDAEAGPIVHALRAVKALAATKQKAPPRDAIPALLLLLRDERPGVRVTALDAAAAWLPDTALAEAVTAFAAGGTGRERGTALLALASAGVPQSRLLVAEAATAADADVRARAAEAAVRLGEAEIAAKLAVDASPLVRGAVLAASLEGAKEDGAGIALAALADRDEAVRGAALDWFAEHPQEARKIPIEKLQRPFAAALADRDPESGLSAVRAMAALAEAEPLVRGVLVALLEQAAGHPAYPLRREAGLALGRLGQEVPELGPARPTRDLTVYHQIVERTGVPRTVEVKTEKGSFRIRLECPTAPLTCLNFLQLAGQGYFDGLSFHRVVADFVVQGGDPRGDGFGGPGYTIRDEINRLRYKRGAVGMALAGPDTGGSQFFVALSPQPHLDGGYTVFGEVVAGMEVVDRLVVGDKMVTVKEIG